MRVGYMAGILRPVGGRGGLSWIESMEDPRGRRVRAEEGVSDVV